MAPTQDAPKPTSPNTEDWSTLWQSETDPHWIPCLSWRAGVDERAVTSTLASAMTQARRQLDPPAQLTQRGTLFFVGEADAIDEAVGLADELVRSAEWGSFETRGLAEELRGHARMKIACDGKHVASAFRFWVFASLALAEACDPAKAGDAESSLHSAIDWTFQAIRLSDPVLPASTLEPSVRREFSHILRAGLPLQRALQAKRPR